MESELKSDAVGEIISDSYTRGFIRKYFGPVPIEYRILFDHFLECIFREFEDLL
jgi:cytoskeletal protein RodZ